MKSIHDEIETWSESKFDVYVQNAITKQLVEIFTHLENAKEEEIEEISRGKKIEKKNDTIFETSPAWYGANKVPYRLEIRDSSIRGAGKGVFIRTLLPSIAPGTVVALYPGLVHSRESIREQEYLMRLFPDKDFMLMTRVDQIIIDGRNANEVPYNPFAAAHKINHCGGKLQPNVLQVNS